MASPRGACLGTRAATCLGFANPDGFILPPGLWPNNILAGISWPDAETALALARPALNLSESPGPRKSPIALDFQWDAGTRAPVVPVNCAVPKHPPLLQQPIHEAPAAPLEQLPASEEGRGTFPSLRLLRFGWFPLHFQVSLGQGHLCLAPAQSPPSLAESQPPASPGCGQTPVPRCLLQEFSIWLSISSSPFPKCFGITPLPAGPRPDLLVMLEISSKALNWQQKERQGLLGVISNWARHTVCMGGSPSPGVPMTLQLWGAPPSR